jgi:type IV pilus assembly protein PilE
MRPLPARPINRLLIKGFTIIELMIVVAIIAVIASIAIPNYQDYIVKSNRSAAKQFILSIANKQEQYLLDNRSYASDLAALGLTAPPETTNKYAFTIDNVTTAPLAYRIVATAQGPQLSDGDLTLTNTGAKTGKW